MLILDSKIPLTKENVESSNLTHLLSDEDLTRLGQWCFEGYTRDKASRTNWEKRMQAGMDLAMQMVEDKNFPWENCSNVALPLVTIAVMQLHARAYPALVSGTDIVKMRVVGSDPEGKEKERANRISAHMSYQVLEEDTSWEEQHDRAIINVGCVGTVFKKTFRKAINKSEMVLAKNLVINYWAKSIEGCPRKTQIIPLFRNDIYERVKRGEFRDILEEPWYNSNQVPPSNNQNEDRRHGLTPGIPDDITPLMSLEQHVDIDLDGDGYAEPYIVTFEEASQCVLRIVTRFDRLEDIERNDKNEVITIHKREFYTKYGLIPSPDGGIYDIGFGVLLGPLNESADTIINQIIDSGTIKNMGGGFLGRGAKIRGGDYRFSMLEWKRIDSTVDDLRKAIYPLPAPPDSPVLFQTLSLIMNYTDRISGSVDINVGENPGQNTPAATSQLMHEQGQKIYSSIFKRMWRSMKEEFKKLYVLNGIYVPIGRGVSFGSGDTQVYREDYLGDPEKIVPAADPNITSDQSAVNRAMMIKQGAMSTPGYNIVEVEKDYLRALKVTDIDRIYPGPDKVPPLPNPKMAVEQLKISVKEKDLELKKMMFVSEMQEEMKLNQAKILELNAKAAKEIAEAKGVEAGHNIAAFEAAIGAMKHHNDNLNKRIEMMMKGMENGASNDGNANSGQLDGMAKAPGNPITPQGAGGSAQIPNGGMG